MTNIEHRHRSFEVGTDDHRFLDIDEARTIRSQGHAEWVTRDAWIRPDRYEFANESELFAHLRDVVGGQPKNGGFSGSMSRKGTYSRRAADGSPVVTLGDPVLDAIASADGTLAIGNQRIDLREGDRSSDAATGAGGSIVLAASDLKYTGIVNGAERWATDDGSLVQYRVGNGRLNFHAWKKHTIYGYWSMGGEVSIYNTNAKFEAAQVFTQTYISLTAPCQTYNGHYDSDYDDSYLDAYDYGWNSDQPERVGVVCKAQWHHARFADIVTAGEGCLRYRDDLMAEQSGFPPDWNTIQTQLPLNGSWTDGSTRMAVISTKFSSLTVDMSGFHRPTAHGSIDSYSTITVTFPDDASYTGTFEAPNRIRWSNGSVWVKVVNTLIDLNGSWTDGGARRAIISEGATSLKIDMSDYDRPAANGSILNNSTIKVTFPDDATITGTLQLPGTIKWSNGSSWTRMS